jgi:hypothetical protein
VTGEVLCENGSDVAMGFRVSRKAVAIV